MAHIIFGIDPIPPFNQQNLEVALRMPGVHHAHADAKAHVVAVEFDSLVLTGAQLQRTIQGIGFRPFVLTESDTPHHQA